MVQSQDARSHKQYEESEVVNHLQERLVSSWRAKQVGQQQRNGNNQGGSKRNNSRVVAVVERATRQVAAEVKRIVAEQGEAYDGYNLYPEENSSSRIHPSHVLKELLTISANFKNPWARANNLKSAMSDSIGFKVRELTQKWTCSFSDWRMTSVSSTLQLVLFIVLYSAWPCCNNDVDIQQLGSPSKEDRCFCASLWLAAHLQSQEDTRHPHSVTLTRRSVETSYRTKYRE